MELYPYQKRVKDLLQGGRSVVLQAPTGAGKTLAAMAPFIEAFFDLPDDAFPKQCIYSVPMRVLAGQFYREFHNLAARYERVHRRPLDVRIQTGERAEDPELLGDLIFATIDQSLSSMLGVPYSLTPGRANLNAGAFFSSYLVFDEFHLFPVSAHGGATGALVTTLQLLQELQGVVPFVLMTATFSSTMLDELARRLGAAVVTVSPDEYAQIASGKGKTPRRRFYHVHDETLTADAVLQAHHSPGVSRSLVICNQVGRAQALYQALRDHPKRGAVEVRLLHSRFTQEDRRRKEAEIAREFGRERENRQEGSMILVATQVVEVGLNITCDRLHTEIAPANAVLQRAGRCARYPGEEGHVHIYMVPERQSRDGSEPKPDFLPYPSDLCQAAWTSFNARDGQEIDFQTEQQIIDEVHTESDRQLLEAMDRQRGAIWSQIYAAMESQDRSQRQDLIRRIDSITVLSGATPEAVGNPFRAQGFSFHRGSVFGLWSALQREREENWEGDEFEEEPWLMALPQVSEPDPETPGAQPEVHWLEVTSQDLLTATNVVVLNSRFCAYDDEVGFRIVAPEAANGWQSQPGEWKQGNRGAGYRYALESYEEHISQMAAIYRQRFQARYAYVGKRLAEGSDAQLDKLERAVHLALACHDAAKMEQRWQRWVRRYQERIGKPIPEPNFMAVHTDFDPTDPAHVQAKKETDREVRRPPHAGESAVATARPIAELLEDPPLARAVLTAIARHHSPSVSTFKPFRLHPAAAETLRRAIQMTGLPLPSKPITVEDRKGGSLDRILIEPGDFQQLCFYFYVVRALRLCDGMSQE